MCGNVKFVTSELIDLKYSLIKLNSLKCATVFLY